MLDDLKIWCVLLKKKRIAMEIYSMECHKKSAEYGKILAWEM